MKIELKNNPTHDLLGLTQKQIEVILLGVEIVAQGTTDDYKIDQKQKEAATHLVGMIKTHLNSEYVQERIK